MGPASVEAVKKGQIGLAYDVGFVLAEVNAGTHHSITTSAKITIDLSIEIIRFGALA